MNNDSPSGHRHHGARPPGISHHHQQLGQDHQHRTHPTPHSFDSLESALTPAQGKQLFGIFKEAKASYKEKKAVISHERSLQRAQTFDAAYQPPEPPRYHDDYDYGHNPHYAPSDARSNASGRSRRSDRSRRRPALTEANLRSHSEVSATPPSAAPPGYRAPYAGTSQEIARSRPSLARAPTEGVLYEYAHPPQPPFAMQRAASDPSMKHKKKKEPDMDLAYGNVPPDLESRTDLDPYSAPDAKEARTLIGRVEGLLEEAQCVQHSAGATISHLQRNPDAAAAVALTLAELSGVLAKMSPAFLGALKGGSPAVFALLASPQFLIAAGAAVGVTVVMFGGWKIIKRMKEQKARREESMAFAAAMGNMPPQEAPQGIPMQGYPPQGYPDQARGAPGTIYYEGDPEEALIIEEELSGIESWRRGISPFGENGDADMELISPEAQRAVRRERRERRRRRSLDDDDEPSPDDSISMAGRSERSHRSSGSRSHARSHYSRREDERSYYSRRDEESEVSRRSGRSRRTMKTIEEGRGGNELDVVLRGGKEKKSNMLKSLFKKKKDKEDVRTMSVMV